MEVTGCFWYNKRRNQGKRASNNGHDFTARHSKELRLSSGSQNCRSDHPTERDLRADWKNGAGKTTIFKIILGLTVFENGRLSIAGKSIKADLESGRKKIGFFIGKNFFDYLTARENLEYYRQMKGIRDKGEKRITCFPVSSGDKLVL